VVIVPSCRVVEVSSQQPVRSAGRRRAREAKERVVTMTMCRVEPSERCIRPSGTVR
jgi:hypothetical protein